ncbi:hypothetical protein ACN47E_005526 [Coniothyrium glycines]
MAPSSAAASPPRKAPPRTVSDYTILPLTLPTLPGLPAIHNDARHYLYIKPHEPSIPTATDDRSLFLANIPIDASETSLRVLFAEQLGGAMVERVEFDASVPAPPVYKRWKSDKAPSADGGEETRGKKRKRAHDEAMVAEGVVEDEDSQLPRAWASEVRRSGSGAVVVFVDRKSARGAAKDVARAVKEGRRVLWKGEIAGVERYKAHNALTYPAPAVLQASVNAYLTQFNALETVRNKLRKTSRSVPDEEGFITVTRGGRAGPARIEEAEKKKAELDERRKNNGVKDDFYRFQNREKRKEAEGLLRRRFEEDRRRVEGMRERRGKIRPEA